MQTQSRTQKLTTIALILFGLLATAPVQATILTFDLGNPANAIPATYGDNVTSTTNGPFSYGMGNGFTPNITTDYATRAIATGDIDVNRLSWWNSSYGDLTNVAYPSYNSRFFGEVTLTPEAGFAVKLNGFDLAGWPQANYAGQTIRIFDDVGMLQEFTNFTVLGAGPSHSPFSFTDLISRSGSLRIQYGFNSWHVGIDNIHFDQVSPVPIPGAILLFGSGLAALAAFGRLKKRMTA